MKKGTPEQVWSGDRRVEEWEGALKQKECIWRVYGRHIGKQIARAVPDSR